jgi:hypothetical protein
MNPLLNFLDSKFNIRIDDSKKVDLLFPRLLDSHVPLTFTGVSPRTYHSWKENNLIPEISLNKESERKWVKLSVIDFIWVKIIQSLRDFGVSYEDIKGLKEILFGNIIQQILSMDEHAWAKVLGSQGQEEIESFRNYKYMIADFLNQLVVDGKLSEIELLNIFHITIGILIHDSPTSLLLYKENGVLKFDFYVYDRKYDEINKHLSFIKILPHIEIPVKGILEHFFDKPKSEQYGEYFGLIDQKEKRVLEAIRKKDFLELHIKRDSNGEIYFETINDGDITDEKATAIRKMLGLGDYQEITLKYRNNKHLYFKNKKRDL